MTKKNGLLLKKIARNIWSHRSLELVMFFFRIMSNAQGIVYFENKFANVFDPIFLIFGKTDVFFKVIIHNRLTNNKIQEKK